MGTSKRKEKEGPDPPLGRDLGTSHPDSPTRDKRKGDEGGVRLLSNKRRGLETPRTERTRLGGGQERRKKWTPGPFDGGVLPGVVVRHTLRRGDWETSGGSVGSGTYRGTDSRAPDTRGDDVEPPRVQGYRPLEE